jgi:AbrB family looped-hinge helix DNA binding protein
MERRMESVITSNGRVTIPEAIVNRLGLRPGDRVRFFVHPDGGVVLLPVLPASALRGMLGARRGPVTQAEIDEAVAAGAAEGAAL